MKSLTISVLANLIYNRPIIQLLDLDWNLERMK